jgi:thioredoxin reductase
MYDVTIIGAGPSGLTALLYCVHYGLSARCVGETVGGRLVHAPDIIDYPGIESMHGKEFIDRLLNQIKKTHGVIEIKSVQSITLDKKTSVQKVSCADGSIFESRALILATGNGKKQRENIAFKFAQQLSLHTQNGLITVDEDFMTSIPGVFASGDCITYPASLEQLATAVTTGIRAAAGAYNYLKKEKPPILWGSTQIARAG